LLLLLLLLLLPTSSAKEDFGEPLNALNLVTFN